MISALPQKEEGTPGVFAQKHVRRRSERLLYRVTNSGVMLVFTSHVLGHVPLSLLTLFFDDVGAIILRDDRFVWVRVCGVCWHAPMCMHVHRFLCWYVA